MNKLYTRQVNLGRRKVISELLDKKSKQWLENGRNLKISNEPIPCRVKLNRVWREAKKNIEATKRRRKKQEEEGTLPAHIHPEVINPYNEHWQDYSAIIPPGGISQKGYVKEAWIEYFIDSITIENELYYVIDPFVHDTEQWIQGFKLGKDTHISLLPSPKIVVKYFRESR